jgi:hypothetical protein
MSLNSHFLNNKSLYGPLKFEYVTSVGNRSFTQVFEGTNRAFLGRIQNVRGG